jgi:hypothetical protein
VLGDHDAVGQEDAKDRDGGCIINSIDDVEFAVCLNPR